MRVAAIDIGTNSVLLLVVEGEPLGVHRVVLEQCRITRLGQGVDKTRNLAPDAIARTLDCLAGYAEILEELAIDRLQVVGTSALRDAQASDVFLESAKAILGVAPRIIAGSVEAELTFRGGLSALGVEGPVVVVDVGGGSTEIITGNATRDGTTARDFCSLELGCVRLTERHVSTDPPDGAAISTIAESTQQVLSAMPFRANQGVLVAVAGTATTLAAIHLGLDAYDGTKVHGHVLSRDALLGLIDRISGMSHAERASLRGMEPRRADVIVAGGIILATTLDQFHHDHLIVSDRGVRFGLIESMMDEALVS